MAPSVASEVVADEFVDFAHRLADAAGAVIRPYFRQPVTIDDKPDLTPVTIADRESEAAMRTLIGRHFPDHGILGEEHGAERADAEYVWVLDPIDGTKSFITGSPLFGSLIALTRNGRPLLGIIDQPILGERWLGLAGQATTLNGAAVRTRSCPDIAKAVMYTWGVEGFEGAAGRPMRTIGAEVKLKRYSADCYAYGLLACGFVDLVMEDTMNPWDFCALVPVVQGAGGVITDWRGAGLGLAGPGSVLACGDPALHGAALRLIAD